MINEPAHEMLTVPGIGEGAQLVCVPQEVHVIGGHTEQPPATGLPHEMQEHPVPLQAPLQVPGVLWEAGETELGLCGRAVRDTASKRRLKLVKRG
jgi:hypothetical protein